MPGTLVTLRHGQSTWNLENLFTGWRDVPLTEQGEAEAVAAGRMMADAGLRFDTSHTSVLVRAVATHNLALAEMGLEWLPVQRHWRLNERHYGALQGLDKKETAERHGAEQTHLWRRSFDVPPPPVDTSSPEHPANDWRYRLLPREVLPASECLADVVARVLPVLAGCDRPAAAGRTRCPRHRPRQLAARPAAAPRRRLPRGDPRGQHSDRGAPPLRVRRHPRRACPPSTSATPTRSPPELRRSPPRPEHRPEGSRTGSRQTSESMVSGVARGVGLAGEDEAGGKLGGRRGRSCGGGRPPQRRPGPGTFRTPRPCRRTAGPCGLAGRRRGSRRRRPARRSCGGRRGRSSRRSSPRRSPARRVRRAAAPCPRRRTAHGARARTARRARRARAGRRRPSRTARTATSGRPRRPSPATAGAGAAWRRRGGR